MAKKPTPTDEDVKTQKLRSLRMAAEAAGKEAGTWGDRTVGEIAHPATGSVYVQVWRGSRRPDPLSARSAQSASVSTADWQAIVGWNHKLRAEAFTRSVVAWNLSQTEAQRIKDARIQGHREAGQTVINRTPGRP